MTVPAFDYAAAIAAARRLYAGPALAVLDPWANFLRGSEGNVTSQNGEDGALAALFARVGTLNRWCFEVGAGDGFHQSNTWALRRCGWEAVLIEADEVLFERLRWFACESRLVRERVEGEALDRILTEVGAPSNLDLGVIDIDGEDAGLWWRMHQFRPRLMLVEFNPTGDGVQGGTTAYQAGLDTLAAVGRRKDYRLVARTPHNAVFVDEGVLEG